MVRAFPQACHAWLSTLLHKTNCLLVTVQRGNAAPSKEHFLSLDVHVCIWIYHIFVIIIIISLSRAFGSVSLKWKTPNDVSMVPWKCGQLLVGMPPVQIHFLHHTLQLWQSMLEHLLNRKKFKNKGSITTLTHATFSLQWQSMETAGVFGPKTT